MKLLVISHDHALLPFAWRAKKQGHDVEVLVGNPRYQHAWDGRLTKLDVSRGKALHGAVRDLIAEQEYTVLTDSREWTTTLAGMPRIYGVGPSEVQGPPDPVEMSVGAWWTGTGWTRRHLLFTENGLWTNGHGPALPGATLLALPPRWRPEWEEALGVLQDRLKAASFLGLVRTRTTPRTAAPSFEAGWSLFHTHALLAAQDSDIASLLDGEEVQGPESRFRLALPISVPPWPHRSPRREEPRAVRFPRELTGWMFWHDIAIEGEEMRTAGLGGLVAVARGMGRTITGARRMALSLAEQLDVPEKQYRIDAGGMSDALWVQLSENGEVD